jgi:hypothetical protein
MEQAVLARRGAREAVADIDPPELHRRIDSILADASMVPGVLVILSAQSVDPDHDPTSLQERAAGVQLIYEGLRLTRRLAHEEPWAGTENDPNDPDDPTDDTDPAVIGTDTDDTDANIDVLVADVLVSRGFYLLAMTDAADRAVETVRAFGRDQTRGREPGADREALDRNLESDVFELAAVAGTTAVDSSRSGTVSAAIDELIRDTDGEPLPDATTLFDADLPSPFASEPFDDHAPTSASDP